MVVEVFSEYVVVVAAGFLNLEVFSEYVVVVAFVCVVTLLGHRSY